MNKQHFLELLQDTKQLLLEQKRHRPFLFTKLPFAKSSPSIAKPKVILPALPQAAPVVAKIEKAPEPEIVLPPPKEERAVPFESLRKSIEKSCSHIRLKDSSPHDEEAVQRKNAWKRREHDVEILLFCMTSDAKQKALLENIAKAIALLGKQTQVIDVSLHEKENSWKTFFDLPKLSFILAPPLETWRAPLLKSHITISSGIANFSKAKVFFLPPLEKLLADPMLKPQLWQTLCQYLGSQA